MYVIDHYIPVLALVKELFGQEGSLETYEYERLRQELVAAIDEATTACHAQMPPTLCEDAAFAVVAFVDEQVLSSNWSQRHEWAGQLLQKEYFSTTNAGVHFFERLERLNPFNPRERDVQEVYFYCLCLGFMGQYYRPADRGTLNTIIRHCGEELAEADGETRMFPEAYPAQLPEDQPTPRRPTNWQPLYIGLPLLIFLGLYLAYRHDIVSLAKKFLLMT